MNNINSFINTQNMRVSGDINLKLYKLNITICAVSSKNSLFNHNLANFNKDARFNQNYSAWFIEIYNIHKKKLIM